MKSGNSKILNLHQCTFQGDEGDEVLQSCAKDIENLLGFTEYLDLK